MNSESLTRKQREYLDFIESFIEGHGFPPTYREIQDSFDLKSSGSSFLMLKKLEEKGFISLKPNVSRSIVILGGKNIKASKIERLLSELKKRVLINNNSTTEFAIIGLEKLLRDKK